ncbi:MAG TPA: inorganic diphosphatase [Terriglobales bacterium]|nr:inorganic diphosphatase [Terriglobales bacterium]
MPKRPQGAYAAPNVFNPFDNENESTVCVVVETGCVVESRLIGVIEGEQTENGKTERNDRRVAVARENHTHSGLKRIADLNSKLLDEICRFFVHYQEAMRWQKAA